MMWIHHLLPPLKIIQIDGVEFYWIIYQNTYSIIYNKYTFILFLYREYTGDSQQSNCLWYSDESSWQSYQS